MDHASKAAPCAAGFRLALAAGRRLTPILGLTLGLLPGLIPGLAGTPSAHAQTPGFHLMGSAPNTTSSFAMGLSADGRIVTGYSGGFLGFVWSESTGRYDFDTVQSDGIFSGLAISGDGTTVTGARGNRQAVRWSGPGTAQNLGFLPTYDLSVGTAVSGDGSIVVGHAYSSTQARSQAFRWTAETGLVGLGFAGPTHSQSIAADISRDGSTVVGFSRDDVTGRGYPYSWTQSTGMQVLPGLQTGGGASAQAVNFDGSIIVGSDSTFDRGVMWMGSSVVDLGLAPGYIRSAAFGVSDDGTVVLGSVSNVSDGTVAVWTPTTGFVPFADYLALHGITIPDGYSIREVTDMSDDGRTFCGNLFVGISNPQAFVVTVPAPGTCALVLAIASLNTARRRRQ